MEGAGSVDDEPTPVVSEEPHRTHRRGRPSKEELLPRRGRRNRRSLAHPGRIRDLVGRPWFEPVVTVVAIVALLGGLYAYAGNWPPLVVVESSSMQHGDHDVLGLVNTGDLVLVKKLNVPSQVTTYVQGLASGYMTYGEYGDVLLYFPNGNTAYTPVIHRAIIWLNWNATAQEFSAPSLSALQCGPSSYGNYEIVPPGGGGSNYGCVSSSDPNAPLSGSIDLFNVGWQSVLVSIDLSGLARQATPHSGFITEGDDNCLGGSVCTYGGQGVYDQRGCAIVCATVATSWVEGVARGMIPWFGAIKLWLSGNPQYVPPETWDYLAATILAILVLPTVVPKLIHHLRERRAIQRGKPKPVNPEDAPAGERDEDGN